MKRIALRVGKSTTALASAAVLISSCVGPAKAGNDQVRPDPVTVLERACLYPDDRELAEPWLATGPDGTVVELWCGSRVEVSRGHCGARLGDEVTEVPCVTGTGAAYRWRVG